jgi:hypothetical protein
MSCCNGKRRQWTAAPATQSSAARINSHSPIQTVSFEFLGEAGISVVGPITRTRYRFNMRGTRIEVDRRDAAYLAGVPNLRRARREDDAQPA